MQLSAAYGSDKIELVSTNLRDIYANFKTGNYDYYFGSLGIGDPDYSGMLYFYYGGEVPILPSKGSGFLESIESVKSEPEKNRVRTYRSVLTKSVCEGYVLPLFHTSTVGMTKPGLDLSDITASDEIIVPYKIRMSRRGK
jgi:hypothetical protein